MERYREVARRIRLELAELEMTVSRAERAIIAAQSELSRVLFKSLNKMLLIG